MLLVKKKIILKQKTFLRWYCNCFTGLSVTADWTASSNQSLAAFGSAVACSGDGNGDGYSDVIVAAGAYDNGNFDEGAVFGYYGK